MIVGLPLAFNLALLYLKVYLHPCFKHICLLSIQNKTHGFNQYKAKQMLFTAPLVPTKATYLKISCQRLCIFLFQQAIFQ